MAILKRKEKSVGLNWGSEEPNRRWALDKGFLGRRKVSARRKTQGSENLLPGFLTAQQILDGNSPVVSQLLFSRTTFLSAYLCPGPYMFTLWEL